MVPKLFGLVSVQKLCQILEVKPERIEEIAGTVGADYRNQAIPKKNGRFRKIDDPNPELKGIQTKIKTRLFSGYVFPSSMKGGIRGENTTRNAKIHKGQPEILKIDLKDFFPRTTNAKVFAQLRKVFKCSTDVASIITKLTTLQRMVPQGAPTSSFITNLAVLPLHDDIARFCKERRWNFTMWVDDITVSGRDLRTGIQPIIDLIHKHEYAVKNEKVEIIGVGNRQEVTGRVVNKKVSVAKKKIEDIRKEIISLRSLPHIPSYKLHSLRGKINYVRSASPKKAEKLNDLLSRVTHDATVIEERKPRETRQKLSVKTPHKFWPRNRKKRGERKEIE